MMVVCKDWLERLRSRRSRGNDSTAMVEKDVSALLNGKSYEQLSQLQRQIQAKLSSGEPVDIEYWEGLLKTLLVWKAKVVAAFLCQAMTDFLTGEAQKSSRGSCT